MVASVENVTNNFWGRNFKINLNEVEISGESDISEKFQSYSGCLFEVHKNLKTFKNSKNVILRKLKSFFKKKIQNYFGAKWFSKFCEFVLVFETFQNFGLKGSFKEPIIFEIIQNLWFFPRKYLKRCGLFFILSISLFSKSIFIVD